MVKKKRKFSFIYVAFTPGTDREMGTDKNKHMEIDPKSATTMFTLQAHKAGVQHFLMSLNIKQRL